MTPRSTKHTPKLCADIIDQEIAAIRAFVHKAGLALGSPAPMGSGIERLMTWIESLPNTKRAQREHVNALLAILDSSNGALLRLMANARDHGETLSTALRADHPVSGSALTLSRGVLEAMLQACYFLDPKASPRTALLRALAYEAATIEGNEATAKIFGERTTPEQRKRARESVDGFHRWLNKSGFLRGHGKDRRQSTWVGFDDEHLSLKFNVTDAMRDYLFDEGFFFSVFSGAAHSRGWMLATTYLPDEVGHVATPDQLAVVATIPLLDASETLMRSVGYYVGIDPKTVIDKTHLRRRALFGEWGQQFSPMSLEEYRTQRTPAKVGLSFAPKPDHSSARKQTAE